VWQISPSDPSPDQAAQVVAPGACDQRGELETALDAVYAILLAAAERAEHSADEMPASHSDDRGLRSRSTSP
jgi:hypothetical protein